MRRLVCGAAAIAPVALALRAAGVQPESGCARSCPDTTPLGAWRPSGRSARG